MKKILSGILIITLLSVFGYGYFSHPKTANAGFTYSRSITINHNKVASSTAETYANFAVMVSSSTLDSLKTVSNGGHVQNNSGYDVAFYSNSDCSTGRLAAERDFYSSSTTGSVFWVKQSSISTTTDSTFYMCYGDSSISTDPNTDTNYGATSTWDTYYKGVYHLSNGTTLNANDSTSNANNGTLVSTPTADTGKIDGAAVFGAGGTERYISTPITNTAYTRGSIEWWQYNTYAYSDPSHIDGFWGHVASSNGLSGQRYTDGNFYVGWQDNRLVFAANSSNYPQNTWTHYSYVWTSGGNNYFYANGVQIASGSSGSLYNTGNNFHIAKVNGWANFTGRMDEFRLSDTNRSADWIATEYKNQSDPGTFITIGTENGGAPATTDSGLVMIVNASTIIINSPKVYIK